MSAWRIQAMGGRSYLRKRSLMASWSRSCMVLSWSRPIFLICRETSGSKKAVTGFLPTREGGTVLEGAGRRAVAAAAVTWGMSRLGLAGCGGLEKAWPAAWLRAWAMEVRFIGSLQRYLCRSVAV